MAEFMLLRMAVMGAVLGMLAPTIMVGKLSHKTWRYFNQRKESRV